MEQTATAQGWLQIESDALRNNPGDFSLLCSAHDACRRAGADEMALHYAQKLIEHHPERWNGYERGARSLLRLVRPEEAKAIAEEGLRRCAEQFHLLCVAADTCRAAGNHDAALDHASKLMREHPDRFNGYVYTAQSLIIARDYEQAQFTVRLGLKRFPSQFNLLCAGDDVCHAAGEREAALIYARRLTEEHPERRTGYLRTARHLVSLDKDEEAVSVIQQGLRRLPNDFDLLRAGDEVCRDSSRLCNGSDFVKALIQHHPESFRQFVPSIKALGQRGNLDESLAMVVERGQEWLASSDHLRIAHLLCHSAGERERALRYAQMLMSQNPRDPGGYILAAQEHFGLKQFSRTIDVLQQGIATAGSNRQLMRLLFEYRAYPTYKQFCAQHEFPWDPRVDNAYAGDDSQVVHWVQPVATRIGNTCTAEPQIKSVSIQPYGRFSNLLIQLTNALFFASRTGLAHLYLPDNPTVRSIFPDKHAIRCQGCNVDILIGEPPADQITLSGTFYFLREHQRKFYAQAPSMRELVKTFRSSTGIAERPVESTDPRTLCIHLRSGDIFRNCNPPQSYGQPPLAYYTLVIRHFRPASVSLVYEDTLNPVIQKLQRFLSGEGIPFSTHSSLNLRDDIRVLISARALVIGRGSFARGVLCFCDQLETLYTFCEETSASVHQNLRLAAPAGTRCFNAVDMDGDYVNSILQGWQNTCTQRSMMCSYPEARLAIEDL